MSELRRLVLDFRGGELVVRCLYAAARGIRILAPKPDGRKLRDSPAKASRRLSRPSRGAWMSSVHQDSLPAKIFSYVLPRVSCARMNIRH